MYDCIVIGAGIAGAACARKLAEEAGKKVLVIERRSHVGGNCYDVLDEYGMNMVHIFSIQVWKKFMNIYLDLRNGILSDMKW